MENDKQYFTQTQIIDYFTNNPIYKQQGSVVSQNIIRTNIGKLTELLEIPDLLSKYPKSVYNEHILNYLGILLWNSATINERMYLNDLSIHPVVKVKSKKKIELKIRVLGSEGSYPNIILTSDSIKYSFSCNIPYLITKDEDQFDNYSEVKYLNINELVFASAVMLGPEYPRCSIQFDESNVMRLSEDAVDGLNNSDKSELLFELITAQYVKSEKYHWYSGNSYENKQYHYSTFNNEELYYQIVKVIDKNNQLLLRTLFYFIKSRMLISNRCFAEDAIANVLFSIEGSLLLLQQKRGLSNTKIDLALLKKMFIEIFHNGESLFDFISEGYEKRISIVHASPKNGVEWNPSLMGEDFSEYYDISRMILLYIITNKITDIE